MLVKCIDTKEKMERSEAYCLNVNGKNKYYSSKEGYEQFIYNNHYRSKSIDLIRDMMGYVLPQMKLPTLTYKKIEEMFKEPIGYDVLYNTLVNYQKDIEWAFQNKEFRSETARVMYLFGIVKSHYMEEWRKKVAEKRTEVQHVQSESEDVTEIETIDRKQTVKDLRGFLDED